MEYVNSYTSACGNEKLYLEIRNREDLFELDMDAVRNYKAYADAWEYVNQNDYSQIIDSLSISKST